MKHSYAFMIFVVLMGVLVTCVVAVMNSDSTQVLLSVFFAMLVVLGPLKIGEDTFDLVDKFIDGFIDCSKKLHWLWHLVFSGMVGLICFIVWPAVAVFFIDNDHLLLGEWYQYYQYLDHNASGFFAYPVYALEFGYLAIGTSILGYVIEGVIVTLSALFKNRMKRGA